MVAGKFGPPWLMSGCSGAALADVGESGEMASGVFVNLGGAVRGGATDE
jgi:hypothetical protein